MSADAQSLEASGEDRYIICVGMMPEEAAQTCSDAQPASALWVEKLGDLFRFLSMRHRAEADPPEPHQTEVPERTIEDVVLSLDDRTREVTTDNAKYSPTRRRYELFALRAESQGAPVSFEDLTGLGRGETYRGDKEPIKPVHVASTLTSDDRGNIVEGSYDSVRVMALARRGA